MLKKVLLSLLVVTVIASLAVLGSFAVFTDSETVDSNTFSTGTVDISTNPTTALVTYNNMAPGDSTTQSLVVTNDGSLELRYAISSSATDPDSKGLKDQLVLTIKEEGTDCATFDGTQLYTGDLDSTDGKLVGDSATGFQAGDRTLAASPTNETLCFRVELPSSTGDAYQDATTTATFTFDAEQTVNN